jgi:hypothetical protein
LEEHQKITSTKGYRSPVEVLKQFTKSNLFVNFKNDNTIPLNPSGLSKLITAKINNDFNGDRLKAEKWCRQKLKQEKIIMKPGENIGFNKLNWFFAICLDWSKVTAKEKNILQRLIQTKGKSEFDYVNLLAQFPFEKRVIKEKYPKLR